MSFEYSPYILPLLAAALVSVFAAIYIWFRRETKGAAFLALLAAGIIVWNAGYALEIAGVELETKLFWGKVQYLGITAIPAAWLLFALAHSNLPFKTPAWLPAALAVMPVVTILLAFTTEFHHWLWTDYEIFRSGSFSALKLGHGWWFWVNWAYSQILILAGAGMMVISSFRAKGLFRWQGALLLVSAFAPWIGNILSNIDYTSLDLTPFAFGVSLAFLLWAIFGFRFGNIAPIARDYVVDSMLDGMIVLDARGNVVDMNSSAARMIGVPVANALGEKIENIFYPWAHLIERFHEALEARETFSVGQGEARRRYEARLSPLRDQQGELTGRVIMLRALDQDAPPPRFAPNAASAARPSQPLPRPETEESTQPRTIWDRLVNYYAAPVEKNISAPEGINPIWYQTRERLFTIVTRMAASIGMAALFVVQGGILLRGSNLVFAGLLLILWVLGSTRRLKYELRVIVFMLLIYGIALSETLNFGFSVESFTFFLSFIVISAVMSTRRGAIHALVLTLLTLGAFAFALGSGTFIPWIRFAGYFPDNIYSGINSLLTFAASATAVTVSVVILIENLNAAWQKETQALNLLQQERDLLEQRVKDRTFDLLQAETKYRTLIEQLPAVVYRDDADGNGTNDYVSPQAESIFGYPASEWQTKPNFWRDALYPEDRAGALATINETLKREHSVSEYRIIARDGQIVWVRDEAKLVRDEQGEPLYVQGILLDITEIKKAEQQIRKLSQAVEQSANAIIITDTQGQIEYVNPQFERATGYAAAAVLGKNPRVLKSGRQTKEYYKNLWDTITTGRVWKGEFLNRRKNGSLFWEAATIAPIMDQNGRITNYVAVKEDITARKQVEEELSKLSRAVEQSGNTVIVMDRQGLIEYVNPKFTEVTGFQPREAVGKATAELMQGLDGPPDFRDDEWWKMVNAGLIWHGEFQNRRKDGTIFWEAATIAPVHNREGEIINFVEIKQDITEQKILQEQLQTQNDYLSIMHQITLDLLNRREPGNLLQAIVERFAVLLDAPFCELRLEKDGYLVAEAFTGNQPNLKGDRASRGQAVLSWQAYDARQPVVIEDYAASKYRREIYTVQIWHATVIFPILAGERCLGTLALGREKEWYAFTPDQVQTGILFARLVALVLDNANLYESAMSEIAERERAQASLQRSNRYQEALNSLLKISLDNQSINAVLEAALREVIAVDWLSVSAKGGIFLFNEETGLLELRAQHNLASEILTRCARIAPGQCLCGIAAETREIQFADCLDARHSIRYQGIEEHGHYNVPLLQGRHLLGVMVLYLPHGSRRTEEEVVFLNAAADAIAGILRRKQAEMLLYESETRFRQIVENASDIIYRTDLEGRFTYANPAALKLLGYASENEVLGKSYLDLTTPEFRPILKQTYESLYLEKLMTAYHEFPVITTDGQMVWVGQNVQLIMDGEQTVGFQAAARDITKLKQAQEALALSRDQALDASRFKSQLLSRVSHELRTPLGGILGYAELLQYKAFGTLSEKQTHAVKHIVESTHYLTNIVNDLLDEAQIESKALSLHEAVFSPADLLERVRGTIDVLAGKKSLTLRAEIAPDLPRALYGDVNRLQQVIVNLAGNSVKFTKKGEICVRFSCPQPAQWQIEVRDTGAGIPLEEQQNIFEPFRQVNNSITRENRGSGLGLSITKQIVELMGGEINLHSEVGKGSAFTITLPIKNEPEKK